MPLISATDEAVEVTPRRRHRAARVVAAVVVVAAAVVWAVFAALTDDDDAAPDALEQRAAMDATALAYTEWLSTARMAECLNERGLESYPSLVAYRDRVAEVAALLDVEASRPESFARYIPRDLPTSEYADAMVRSIEDGGCMVWRPILDLQDRAAIDAAVDQARGDAAFATYVSDSLWADANPAELLSIYLAASSPGGEEALAPDASALLDSAIAIAGSASTWRAGGIDEAEGYRQAWGSTVDGEAIVIRVEPAGVAHEMAVLWGTPANPVVCGDVQASLSIGTDLINFDGPRRGPAFDIHAALEESWCPADAEAPAVP
ncbi:hypothetical protein [Demequina sp. NBRC 110052]|uniref:hypothetical protein n=1 Tax=Demequina sp. NBRC 110052 TaxID=1570341 RepID=UPI0011816D5A|nr:hypothetical protein [Demequina sp. NBRC 110052]